MWSVCAWICSVATLATVMGAWNGRDPAHQDVNKPVTISITDAGYEPDSITVTKDHKTTITFVRKSDKTCGTEIVIPEYKIKKDLPLNSPVTVEITPTKTGKFTVTCGMDMLRGSIIVK